MIACSFFVIASSLVTSNQAFLSGVMTSHLTSGYGISTERQIESNKWTLETNNDNYHSIIDSAPDDHNEETVYMFGQSDVIENGRNIETGSDFKSESQNPLDPWSIVWYIGSFGGLVAFFLIVSCSEWCCRRNSRPYAQRSERMNTAVVVETPPPPYHLFAPPSYDSVNYGEIFDKTSGEKLDIYVISVPIHRPMTQEPA